jgi:gamma-glutamylcyclotransferase (GGCT)/AIG2-like uncharacterized protein YtfP
MASTAGTDRVTVSRLFVYGTLQDDEQVRSLAGRRLRGQPAVLEGYCRMLDPAIGYPVVHPLSGSSVDGKLLDDVDDRTLAAFDAYEGDQYRRVIVQVQTSDGDTLEAYMYVPVQSPRPTPR